MKSASTWSSRKGRSRALEAQAHPRRLEQRAASLGSEAARLAQRLEELRAEMARPFDDARALAALRGQRDAIVERLQFKDVGENAVLNMEDAAEPALNQCLDPVRDR